ncbi:MAG: hypothetical protein K2Q11_00865 [Burkholderiaceae bacterium]|nr:hypothetical protein [Burkholderiaceae bacterium]
MAALAYPLGHKIKNDPALSAPQVLAKAQALGVKLALSYGELHAVGCRAGIAQLAQDIRACKPQLVQLLSKPVVAPSWSALPPDTGMARLLALAMALCDRTGASDKARQDWHADIEQAVPQHRGDLLALLQRLVREAMPPAVVAVPSPSAPALATTWREADKADQAHHWSCKQCRTGAKCLEGQRLSDAYIEAATRERFIGAKTDPAKPLPKFHAAQPWRAADKAYQALHWSCGTCKAAARSGHSERCIQGQHLYNLYEQAVPAMAVK